MKTSLTRSAAASTAPRCGWARLRVVACWGLTALGAWHGSGAAAVEKIPVITYHTHDPFIVAEGKGLTYDLVAYLNAKAAGKYEFEAAPMSRPRLNRMIETPPVAVVPWVNPVWFKDADESRYLWSAQPLMEDGNAVISRADRRFVYEGPSSIEGLVLGGLRGHVYADIDDFIANSSSTRRVDADNHFSNFEKLLNNRIDITITPESAALFLIRQHDLTDKLFISPKPHARYSRRIMVTNDRADILSFVNDVLAASADDPDWAAMFARYR